MIKKKTSFIQTSKDVKKVIKSIAEIVILAVLLYIIIHAWTNFSVYKPFTESSVSTQDYGFVVVSYYGVERSGNNVMIGVDRLETHLKALYDSGYKTITQQDVIDYYENNKSLPEKSLLLIFEDANREASIFAQKIMEKYNFKATILNFGNGFTKGDPKLLNSKDIARMEKSTFWEVGTNGYRMEYINVFDKDGNYLGEMDPLTLNSLKENIGNDYDHFLMDYIRDKKNLPKESYDDMVSRITGDYEKMKEEYEREIGYMPGLYAIINPNTGMFGHNTKVSAVNEACIKELFKINLNRLGYSLNNRNNSIYDLTRTQPRPYWYDNHLLMRLWSDTGQSMAFVTGSPKKAALWDNITGAAQFKGEEIILTSLPDGIGQLCLKNSASYFNVNLKVQMKGNKLGSQSILLRMDEKLQYGITVTIKNNVLYIYEAAEGYDEELFSLDLNILDGFEEASDVINEAESGSRQVSISLIDDKLSVYIDKEAAAVNIPVHILTPGFIGLQSETSIRMQNQRIPVDNIYDGVFHKLVISEYDGAVIYDNTFKGMDKFKNNAGELWKDVTDWFIKYM